MFPAPVGGDDNHHERLAMFGHKLGNPFCRIVGHSRKTLLGCLELAGVHGGTVLYSVLSVQNFTEGVFLLMDLPAAPGGGVWSQGF
jgi:hypothetical protein